MCKGAKLDKTKCSTNDNKMSDWNEWWIDLHSDSCKANAHNVMTARIKAAAAKGCDGVDPDNVDSVSTYLETIRGDRLTGQYINTDEQKHGNTELDQFNYLMFLSQTARENKLLIDLKNGGDMIQSDHQAEIVAAFDFNVIEQCVSVILSPSPISYTLYLVIVADHVAQVQGMRHVRALHWCW